MEDYDFKGDIKLPAAKKFASLTFTGNDINTTLTYKADLSPAGNVTFKNLTLNSLKASPKLNIAYNIGFDGVVSNQTFSVVTGSGKGTLSLTNGTKLEVTGAVSAPNLVMDNTSLASLNAGINITGNTTLTSANIDVKTAATFKNIESLDSNNTITYGELYKHKLTITGCVNEKTAGNAINILPKFLIANDYADLEKYENKDIVFSKNASPIYFVVDRQKSEDGTATVKYNLKRVKTALRLKLENVDKQVALYEVDKKSNTNIPWGSFDTIKEAFAEIELSGGATKEFLITIDPTVESKVAPITSKDNIVTPKKAEIITIQPAGEEKVELDINNAITLNSVLNLKNVKINDLLTKKGAVVPITVKINDKCLYLENVDISACRIGTVTGNGVNGRSLFRINNSGFVDEGTKNFIVAGDINNVSIAYFDNTNLTVLGKTNVGSIMGSGVFLGTAAIKTKKLKGETLATAIASNISVARQVEGFDKEGNPAITLGLLYKDKKGNLSLIGDSEAGLPYTGYAPEMFKPGNLTYKVINAPKAISNRFDYGDDYLAASGNYKLQKFKGGIYLADINSAVARYSLEITEDYSSGKTTLVDTFSTYKEVIDEISTRKDLAISYVIRPLVDELPAESMVMPKAGTAKAIYLCGKEGTIFNFTNKELNLTCDICYDGINVVQPKVNINIGTNTITFMNECYFENTINTIKGAGISKKNKSGQINSVRLYKMESCFYANNISEVGEVVLDESTLNIGNSIKVGRIVTKSYGNSIRVPSFVKTSGKKITGITTNAYFVNGIYNESESSAPTVDAYLMYKGTSEIDEFELNYSKLYKSKYVWQLVKSKKLLTSDDFYASDSLIYKKVDGVYVYYYDYYDPEYEEW